jgi:hypothetical protein
VRERERESEKVREAEKVRESERKTESVCVTLGVSPFSAIRRSSKLFHRPRMFLGSIGANSFTYTAV